MGGWTPARRGCLRAAAVLLGLAWLQPVRAQVFKFEDAPVPKEKSLSAHYIFYVYTAEDAPDASLGDPELEFTGLHSKSLSPERTEDDLKGYQGLQVSVMPYYDFWELVNPDRFCSTPEDVRRSIVQSQDQMLVSKAGSRDMVYSHTVNFISAAESEELDQTKTLSKSGAYVLVYSNCGNFDEATIAGRVKVRNPYGFLPGNEYYKMPFYGMLTYAYIFFAVVWLALVLRWWKDLFYIHNGITMVILIGTAEAVLWHSVYKDWNASGVRRKPLFFAAILSSVLKSVVSYILVLLSSLGSGVTRSDLDSSTSMKVHFVALVFIVADFAKLSVMAFQHSHALKLNFMLISAMPALTLHCILFYWISSALSSLIQHLQETQQHDKVAPFLRMKSLMCLVLAAASASAMAQLFDISCTTVSLWKYHWLIADGIPQVIFALGLLACMSTWAPSAAMQRFASVEDSGATRKIKKGYRAVPNPEAIGAAEDDDGAMVL